MDEVQRWPQHWQIRHWSKGSRYYVAEVRQDLFGVWQLARRWGRSGTRLGGERHDLAANLEDARAQLERLTRRRIQRGYQEVTSL